MIKYRLNCNDCNMSFDSWFASSKEFERLKKKKLLNCHNCNSSEIEKTIMSPRLINKSNEKQDFFLMLGGWYRRVLGWQICKD